MHSNAAKWFKMIKDTVPTEETFKTLFLKHCFSEDKQWDIFIKCTEARKKPISNNFQEHFHYWMAELKYLDIPKMDEKQAINIITKHFPIAIQAYIQTTQERKFLNIWENWYNSKIAMANKPRINNKSKYRGSDQHTGQINHTINPVHLNQTTITINH